MPSTLDDSPPGEEYDDDTCPICHQLLDNPASTACGHTACLDCLLTWIAASRMHPQPLNSSFQISTEPRIDGLSFICPFCRTETMATLDGMRWAQLREREHNNFDADVVQNVSIPLPSFLFVFLVLLFPPLSSFSLLRFSRGRVYVHVAGGK